MSIEIERKFLVTDNAYRNLAEPVYIRQGFIRTADGITVRVRIAGDEAFVVFGLPGTGLTRVWNGCEIPVDKARQILDDIYPKPQVEKNRYVIQVAGSKRKWEVDEFLGDNAPLVIAEIELGSEDEQFERPDWLGEEVSQDPRYRNASLAVHPYREWGLK